MAEPAETERSGERLFSIWLEGVEDARIERFVREGMGGYDARTFHRAAREILAAYERHGAPLRLLAGLGGGKPALRAMPSRCRRSYANGQRVFSRENPWFAVGRVTGRSHFLMLEMPGHLAARIEGFVHG